MALAGPVEFGMAELQRAVAARGLNPRQFVFKTEVTGDPADSYRITPGLIAGGDLRGIMYGLLDAAEQIRATGRVRKAQGSPALAIRGVRMLFTAGAIGAAEWDRIFRTLTRNRFNRFTIVAASLDAISAAEVLESLRSVSNTAAEYGIELALSLAPNAGEEGAGVSNALGKILSSCPGMRSVELKNGAGMAAPALEALRSAGRRVTLETSEPGLASKASAEGIPVRMSVGFPGEAPFARRGQFLWELSQAPARNTRASDIAALAAKLASTGAGGFEVEMTQAERQAAIELDRAPARLPAFFLLGRLAYDPKSAAAE